MALINFNAKEIALPAESSGDSYDPIPDGEYTAQIVESRLAPTNSGNGHYLELTWRINEGPYERRLVWDLLNIDNPSADTVERAKKDLARICRALGLDFFADSSELHGMPCLIKVATRPASNGFDAKNQVKSYRALELGEKSAPASSGAPAAPPWQTSQPPF